MCKFPFPDQSHATAFFSSKPFGSSPDSLNTHTPLQLAHRALAGASKPRASNISLLFSSYTGLWFKPNETAHSSPTLNL